MRKQWIVCFLCLLALTGSRANSDVVFEQSGVLASGGEVALSTPNLKPGWYLIQVKQIDIDVAVSAEGESTPRVDVQTFVERFGDEYLAIQVINEESLKVLLTAPDQQGTFKGRFELALSHLADGDVSLYSALTKAGQFGGRLDNKARKESIGYLTEALESGDLEWSLDAQVLYRIAYQNYWVLDIDAALDAVAQFEKSAAPALRPEWSAAADTLMGEILMERGRDDYAEADARLRDAIESYQDLNDSYHAAKATNSLALLESYRADLDEAERLWKIAISQYQSVGADYRVAQSLSNIGYIYEQRREFLKAIAFYDKGLLLLQGPSNHGLKIILSINKASALKRYGLPNDALLLLDDIESMMDIEEGSPDRIWLLTNVAAIYRAVGNADRAARIMEQIVKLRRRVNEGSGLVRGLIQLGDDYRVRGREGDIQRATATHDDAIRNAANDRHLARAHRSAAKDYIEIGQYAKALEHADQSIEIAAKLDALGIGQQVAFVLADLPIDLLGERREWVRSSATALLEDDNLQIRANAKRALSILEPDAKKKKALLDSALEDIDAARQAVPNPWLAVHLAVHEYPLIESSLELIWSPDSPRDMQAKALELAQRARSTSLLQLLAETGVLEAIEGDRGWRFTGTLLDDEFKLTEAAIRKDVELARSRSADNQYQTLLNPEAAVLSDLQTSLSEEEGALFYFVGRESGIGWFISKDSVSSWELPSRAALRELSATIRKGMSSRGAENSGRVMSDLRRAGAVLLPPDRKISATRLFVIPDDALSTIPFPALATTIDEHPAFLVEQASLTQFPSLASVLHRSNQNSIKAPEAMLFLGSSDTGLKAAAAEQKIITRRLPELEVESLLGAKAVAALFASAGEGFDVLHIAAHANPMASNPERAHIEFGLTDDEMLLASSLYAAPRRATPLVFLSACETSVGEFIRGDATHGLVRAMLHSGAENVIATNWRVSDRASALIVGRFYEALAESDGDIASALQNLQKSLLKENGVLRHPAYWAAYSYFAK